MVVAPSVVGVKVAVYTVDELAAKLDNEPPVTVISPTTKSAVSSHDVKVNDKVASLEVAPSKTSTAVMVIVGIAPPSVMVQLSPSVAVIFSLAAEAAEQVVYLLLPPSKVTSS
jgi:hypothetical protein